MEYSGRTLESQILLCIQPDAYEKIIYFLLSDREVGFTHKKVVKKFVWNRR